MAIDMPLDGYALLQEYRQRTLADEDKRQRMAIQQQEAAQSNQLFPLKYAGMNMDLQRGNLGMQATQLQMEKQRRDMALQDQQRAAMGNLANLRDTPPQMATVSQQQPALSGQDANGAQMQGPQEPKLTQVQTSPGVSRLSKIGDALIRMGKPDEAIKYITQDRLQSKPEAAHFEKTFGNDGNVIVNAFDRHGNLIKSTPTDGKSKADVNLMGGRESVFLNRVLTASNQVNKDLLNIVELPLSSSRGLFGGRGQGKSLFEAGKESLATKLTTQDVQTYNTLATGIQRNLAAIEAAGLAPPNSLMHMMDGVIFKEGDTNFTKMAKLAQTRQVVEAGLETILANPRLSPEQKKHAEEMLGGIRKSVPFTVREVMKLGSLQNANPNATLKDVINESGKNKASPEGATPQFKLLGVEK